MFFEIVILAWSAYFWFIEIFSDQFLWNWNSFCCCLFSSVFGGMKINGKLSGIRVGLFERKFKLSTVECGWLWLWGLWLKACLIGEVILWAFLVFEGFFCVLEGARLRLGRFQWFCIDETEKMSRRGVKTLHWRVMKSGSTVLRPFYTPSLSI